MKYRLKAASGAPVDRTVAQTWARVDRALAEPEAEPAKWAPVFAEAMEGFRIGPAGGVSRAETGAAGDTILNFRADDALWPLDSS